uniref:ATP synthase subunit a n=1 Tax=Prionospio sp. 5 MH-2023 TaxID=3059273 RepID=A0AAU6QH90_9ANNE
MMVDIFSSFDPATTSIFNFSPFLFWSINFVTLAFLHPLFWASPSQLFWLFSIPTDVMNQQASRTSTSNLKGMTTLLVALYILITMVNFMGVIPYVFSSSSHLIFTLSFGIPLWLSLIISSATFSPSTTLASLLPGGAPAWLNPFLILIETVSTLVRPVTLSVRLAANMSAGHIVLTLIGVYFVYALLSANFTSAIFLFLIQAGYTVFELGICIIQAYIFCLLLSL